MALVWIPSNLQLGPSKWIKLVGLGPTLDTSRKPHSKEISLVPRTTQRRIRSSEKLDGVESKRALRQPFKLEPTLEKSENIYGMRIPNPWILSTDKAPKLQ
ncbi:hypothetical protein PIB30_032126 [Stylosanthes scabra]|uniref:Uncharacterized protein n=1 Tax=Stylosanthes scabra TaxID=79078 RepID=A0ABU6VDP2_9FABA|nr:hypothetical protein [Stylosanthes scabra]